MKTTLLIMAAGIGSRFGTGIKQLEPADDAGFNHVVFIIRKDVEKEFKEVIGDHIASMQQWTNRLLWTLWRLSRRTGTINIPRL